MARQQLADRESFFYPPYARLVALTLRHRDPQRVRAAAQELAARLRERFGRRVLGPMAPPVDRVRGEWLAGLLLKIESGKSFARARELLRRGAGAVPEDSGVQIGRRRRQCRSSVGFSPGSGRCSFRPCAPSVVGRWAKAPSRCARAAAARSPHTLLGGVRQPDDAPPLGPRAGGARLGILLVHGGQRLARPDPPLQIPRGMAPRTRHGPLVRRLPGRRRTLCRCGGGGARAAALAQTPRARIQPVGVPRRRHRRRAGHRRGPPQRRAPAQQPLAGPHTERRPLGRMCAACSACAVPSASRDATYRSWTTCSPRAPRSSRAPRPSCVRCPTAASASPCWPLRTAASGSTGRRRAVRETGRCDGRVRTAA